MKEKKPDKTLLFIGSAFLITLPITLCINLLSQSLYDTDFFEEPFSIGGIALIVALAAILFFLYSLDLIHYYHPESDRREKHEGNSKIYLPSSCKGEREKLPHGIIAAHFPPFLEPIRNTGGT